jgi:hypothetical protein
LFQSCRAKLEEAGERSRHVVSTHPTPLDVWRTEMGLLLLIVLILLLVGGLPTWPHSRDWGYAPSGLLGTILIIVLIMVLLGYIPGGF